MLSVTSWIKKLNEICEEHGAKNIYNAGETGLFYRILPNKTMLQRRKVFSADKSSKERITVVLCYNREGSLSNHL